MNLAIRQEIASREQRIARATKPDELKLIAASLRRTAEYVSEQERAAVIAIAERAEKKIKALGGRP